MTSSIYNLPSSIHILTSFIHNLTSSIHNLTSSIHNLTSSIPNLTSSIHNLTSSIQNLTSSIYNLTSFITIWPEIKNFTSQFLLSWPWTSQKITQTVGLRCKQKISFSRPSLLLRHVMRNRCRDLLWLHDDQNSPNLLDRDDILGIIYSVRWSSFPAYKSLILAWSQWIVRWVTWSTHTITFNQQLVSIYKIWWVLLFSTLHMLLWRLYLTPSCMFGQRSHW